jgi:hypothetical protein
MIITKRIILFFVIILLLLVINQKCSNIMIDTQYEQFINNQPLTLVIDPPDNNQYLPIPKSNIETDYELYNVKSYNLI